MWPPVCAHGLACERNTARCRIWQHPATLEGQGLDSAADAQPNPRQLNDARQACQRRALTGRPSGRRTQQCGLRVGVAGASRFVGAWILRPGAQCQEAGLHMGPKAVSSSRAPRAYPRLRTHVCRPRAHTFGNVHTHTRAHTRAHTRTCTHVYACISMHAHTHS